MGYRVEVGGPVRPALVSVRIGAEGSPAVEEALGLVLPRPAELASANGSVTVFGLGPDEWLVRTGGFHSVCFLGMEFRTDTRRMALPTRFRRDCRNYCLRSNGRTHTV